MNVTRSTRPDASEHSVYFGRYVALVPDGDIVDTNRTTGDHLVATLRAIPESRGGYRYADGKWSIRTVIGHLIDAERVFAYRALHIARGDAAPLPGFEENDYAITAGSDERTVANLVDELAAVRESTMHLYASFSDAAWSRRGVANESEVSVRALAWINAGHVLHHLRVLRERYDVAS